MKSLKSILTLCLLILSNCLFSQEDSTQSFGSGNVNNASSIYDSVPAEVLDRIHSFLESRGVEPNQRIANFQNEKYLTVIPLKKDGEILVIWSDYHFNNKGECILIRTTIASMDDVDCMVLGIKFCTWVSKLYFGYEKEFKTQYNDYIYFFERASGSYFEVKHPQNSNQTKIIKFDIEGNLISE